MFYPDESNKLWRIQQGNLRSMDFILLIEYLLLSTEKAELCESFMHEKFKSCGGFNRAGEFLFAGMLI